MVVCVIEGDTGSPVAGPHLRTIGRRGLARRSRGCPRVALTVGARVAGTTISGIQSNAPSDCSVEAVGVNL
ncbi:hypothetical protein GCM10023197_31560 [Gordonia humi]